ncbi:MAG: hypothetical protein N4A46_11690, partial [Schleiferiaceae bacterium]|nr:hypothetical protein [Schleiferiaceae bacterium]
MQKHLRFWLKSCALVILILGFTPETKASHYRYGSISYEHVSGNTYNITVKQGWRNGWFGVNASSVGTTVNTGALNITQSGSFVGSIPLNLTVTSVNTAEDWFFAEGTFSYTFASTGLHELGWSGCCRISLNTYPPANSNFNYSININVGIGNSSPVQTIAPIINVQTNQPAATFNVPAADSDGDALSYSILSGPPGLSINPTTGQITWNTQSPLQPIGSLHVVQAGASDGNTTVFSDFIVRIVQTSTPPVFDYGVTPADGFAFQVSPGTPVNFTIKADDSDPGSTVTLSAVGLPSSSTHLPTLPTTASSSTLSSFSWVPTSTDLGTFVINYTAQDNNGVQEATSVTILVSLKPVFDISPGLTPPEGIHTVIEPGTNFSFIAQAYDPDPVDVVQIISAEHKQLGGDFTTHTSATLGTIPSAAANPTSVSFSWTPAPSEWGHQHCIFTAQDSYGDETEHEVSMLVNTTPSFTSTPVLTAFENQPYLYNITVVDQDMAEGDIVDILGITVPSWLTVTDLTGGIATLSGTPGAGEVGTHFVEIEAQDINHHTNVGGIPRQQFTITVNPCAITLSTSLTKVTCPGGSDGTATVVPSNGAAPYTYLWSDGQTTATAVNLPEGNIYVDVTDANGCTKRSPNMLVGQEDLVPPTAIAQNLTAELDQNGNASILVSGNYTLGPIAGTLPIQNSPAVATTLSCDCPSGSVAVGYEGFAGCITDNFRLICREVNQDGTLGAATSVTCFSGGGTTTPFSTSLTGDNVLVGFSITDVDYQFQSSRVHIGVVGHGKSLSEIGLASSNTTNTVSLPGLNGAGCYSSNPNTTTQYAPDGHVIVGMDVNPVAYSSGVKFKYAQLSGTGGLNYGSYDNCGIASMSASQVNFNCSEIGANTVTLTVTDLSGISSNTTAIVTVVDNLAPTAVAQNQTIYLDANGQASIAATQVDNGSSDNCGPPLLLLDKTTFDCTNVGPNTVILEAKDASGNSSTATAIVNVVDDIYPTLVAPADIVVCENEVVT